MVSRWGGIQSFWENEADLLQGKKPKFNRVELKLKKLTGLCYATDELLQDATALEAIIGQAFAEEFWIQDGRCNHERTWSRSTTWIYAEWSTCNRCKRSSSSNWDNLTWLISSRCGPVAGDEASKTLYGLLTKIFCLNSLR